MQSQKIYSEDKGSFTYEYNEVMHRRTCILAYAIEHYRNTIA